MRLDGQRESSNVDDQRGSGGGGGGRGRVALTGGTIVVVLIISAITGVNPLVLLSELSGGSSSTRTRQSAPVNPNDEGSRFVRKVLATTEDAWDEKLGAKYTEPHLTLFRGEVDTACGYATAAVGPFYCPSDRKAYLDLDFFDELSSQFGAPGDFASAYVIAHEIGHHVQNLMGTSDAHEREKQNGATGASVKLELQADCYAGVWGAYVKRKGILDTGDVDEALRAANSIGDDTLQKRGRGRIAPDTFTHGTSAQRVKWFKRGMDSGDPKQCDTWTASSL